MWLKQMKIAIAQRNTDAINKLLDTTLEFNNLEDMKSAKYLLKEAADLLYELREETSYTMSQLKQNIELLNVINVPSSSISKLDVKL